MSGIEIIKTVKFKSNAVAYVMSLGMDDYVTDYNLIGALLKKGCRKFPSTPEIEKHLQDMYGGVFDIVVSKKGEKLFLNFYIQFIDDRFALDDESILEKAVNFLSEIINNPLIDENGFNEEYFSLEKTNLKDLINSRKDNKDSYAVERIEELLLEGEPASIYKYGNIDRLEKINNKELSQLWMKLKDSCAAEIFACGNIDKTRFEKLCEKLRTASEDYKYMERPINEVDKVVEIKEQIDINQGKLCIGFKSDISIFKGDYFALSVMNSILGGGTHSKLFNEVREKNSLAYYSFSFVEKFVGILVMASGIDPVNFEKARDISLAQLEEIRKGVVSEQEILSAKRKLVSDLKALTDSIYSYIDYITSLRAYGINYEIADIIKGIEEVTLDRIIEASKKIYLNNIYFLTK